MLRSAFFCVVLTAFSQLACPNAVGDEIVLASSEAVFK